MLSTLLEWQQRLMDVLGVTVQHDVPFHEQKAFVDAVIGIAKEALETHDAIGSIGKPWKTSSEDAIKEELVDVLFFWLECCIVANLSVEDIHDLYFKKLRINVNRAMKQPHDDVSHEHLLAILEDLNTKAPG